jgi:hypothetical protein
MSGKEITHYDISEVLVNRHLKDRLLNLMGSLNLYNMRGVDAAYTRLLIPLSTDRLVPVLAVSHRQHNDCVVADAYQVSNHRSTLLCRY